MSKPFLLTLAYRYMHFCISLVHGDMLFWNKCDEIVRVWYPIGTTTRRIADGKFVKLSILYMKNDL